MGTNATEVERLLEPVPGEDPCGPNLEYEAPFFELSQAIEFPADAERGPDWNIVRTLADGLLVQSKDLRAAFQYARASLRTAGFSGFRDGLAVMAGLLDRFWDGIHPRLDENGDATARINIVQSLCHPPELYEILGIPVVRLQGLGAFSVRQLQMTQGALAVPEDTELPDTAHIEAAFRECVLEELRETADGIKESIEQFKHIDQVLSEKLGSDGSPDLTPLLKTLGEIDKVVAERLAARATLGEESGAGGDAAVAAPSADAGGPIRNRQDALRVLEQVSRYFEQNEPSSPIPYILGKARDQVDKNFVEILKNIAPGGIKDFEVFGGGQE